MKQSAFSRFFKKNTGANFVDYSGHRHLLRGRLRKYLQLQPPFPQGTRSDALTIQAALESVRDTGFASRLSLLFGTEFWPEGVRLHETFVRVWLTTELPCDA
jgi:hypothetical protein